MASCSASLSAILLAGTPPCNWMNLAQPLKPLWRAASSGVISWPRLLRIIGFTYARWSMRIWQEESGVTDPKSNSTGLLRKLNHHNMLFERSLSIFSMTSLNQHKEYCHFRYKIQLNWLQVIFYKKGMLLNPRCLFSSGNP